MSVNEWMLALGIALTNLPSTIEENVVVVEVRLRSPTVHFTILPHLSAVAPPQYFLSKMKSMI